jgi:2-polyprenyl-6-methoxyphenol hydroxylase-like FAD-dependent oxidoreductase
MAGLFAALLLRQDGWNVDVYERIGAELAGRGAGIVTHSELFEVLSRGASIPQPLQSE